MLNCMILNQLLRNFIQSHKMVDLERLIKSKSEKDIKKENLEEVDQPLIQKSFKENTAETEK